MGFFNRKSLQFAAAIDFSCLWVLVFTSLVIYRFPLGTGLNSNGRTVRDQESGVVELSGDLIIFKGQSPVVRYRFINCQQALDDSTVLTLLPENSEVTAAAIITNGNQWTRPAPRK